MSTFTLNFTNHYNDYFRLSQAVTVDHFIENRTQITSMITKEYQVLIS